ncbi:MAG TPA: hypothetical protein VNC22_23050 [Sporichthya sp.]|nr:hypothetical protein [Sporichthya sp.]
MTEDEAHDFIAEMRLAFPASKPVATIDEEVALWIRDFGNVAPEEMAKAVTVAIDQSRYYPTLKEMRKRLERLGAASLPREGCRCDGVGYYEAAPRQWIPCPSCLPAGFQRWSEGHWGADHWCEQCATVRRGDGPIQVVDERKLTQRPVGATLERDQNLLRLRAIRQVTREIAEAGQDPRRYRRMSRAQIDKHWEDRLNELIAAGVADDPEAEIPPPVLTLVPDLFEALSPDVDEDGCEIL